MAWPKGVKRKPATTESPAPPKAAAAPTPVRRAAMKAKPNWEEYDASEDSEDRLHIGRELFPEGFDFQWVTDTVYGQQFTTHRNGFERKGWTPVHQEDFDGVFDGKFMPKGAQGEITVDGLVLMARPLEFSIRSRKEDHRKALERVQIKQQQLTGGEMPGVSLDTRHPTAVRSNKINRTYEPVPIPQDEE